MKIKRTMIFMAVLILFGTWVYADECNTLRYVDNNDGTITDCRTGLIWLKDANCTNTFNGIDKSSGYLTWYDAMKWVAGLYDTGSPPTGCGLSDSSYPGEWRLPTITEWRAMVAAAKKLGLGNPILTDATGTAQWTSGNPFLNVQLDNYWSSTTNATFGNSAWGVGIYNGSVFINYKSNYGDVWPVRGGQSGEFGSLRIQ